MAPHEGRGPPSMCSPATACRVRPCQEASLANSVSARCSCTSATLGGKPGSAACSACTCSLQSYGRCHQHHLSAAGERPASAKATFMAGTRPRSKREARRQEAGKWQQRSSGMCTPQQLLHMPRSCLMCPSSMHASCAHLAPMCNPLCAEITTAAITDERSQQCQALHPVCPSCLQPGASGWTTMHSIRSMSMAGGRPTQSRSSRSTQSPDPTTATTGAMQLAGSNGPIRTLSLTSGRSSSALSTASAGASTLLSGAPQRGQAHGITQGSQSSRTGAKRAGSSTAGSRALAHNTIVRPVAAWHSWACL